MVVYANSLGDNLYIFISSALIAFGFIFLSKMVVNKLVSTTIKIFGLILFNVMTFIDIGHFYLFHDKIRASSLFIFLSTNREESHDFFSLYMDRTLILFLILLFVGIIISIKSIFFFNDSFGENSSKGKYINFQHLFVILLILSVFSLNHSLRASTLPYVVYTSFNEYKTNINEYNKLAEDRLGGIFTNLEQDEIHGQEVYILIIGESTSRKHMQLYDYYRNTNPKLSGIKEELIIYNDVISPNAHTIESLEKSLSFATHSNPDAKRDGNIIQLFNRAGFSTYWISNQVPFGLYETTTTIMSKSCDMQIFTNVSMGHKEVSYDEKILNPFRKIIEKSDEKQFVIIHLYGTHSNYSRRYPPSFDFFKDDPRTLFYSMKSKELINTYDNAIRYNDSIVNEIINITRNKNAKSFVLYFSDHGEEMFDAGDFAGHSDGQSTKLMLDIPFVLWKSNNYKNDDLVYVPDRKYSTENLIFSLSDLAKIKYKEFDSSRSIFSKHFIERNRHISNGRIYEDLYGKEKN